MNIEEYERRKKSFEKMKELHKDDPYILSYLVDIERNWEKSLKKIQTSSLYSICGGPHYRY